MTTYTIKDNKFGVDCDLFDHIPLFCNAEKNNFLEGTTFDQYFIKFLFFLISYLRTLNPAE
jgi:hypothetical protein